MKDKVLDAFKKMGFQTGYLVDDPFGAPKEDVKRFLAFFPNNYLILRAIKDESVKYDELLGKLNMKEEKFADYLRVLNKYEIIKYEFKEQGLFISAPGMKEYIQSFYNSLVGILGREDEYPEKLKAKPAKPEPKIYYDFPVKGRAIKKVKLSGKFFETIEDLAEMLKKDFSLNEL